MHISAYQAPARHRPASWPRLFAQRIATGEVFEIERGRDAANPVKVDEVTKEMGAGWQVWPEHRLAEGRHVSH